MISMRSCDSLSRISYGVIPGSRLGTRSEEHTSELQSQSNLVCRLLLEKKKHTDDPLLHPHNLTHPRFLSTSHSIRPVLTHLQTLAYPHTFCAGYALCYLVPHSHQSVHF